VVVAAEVEQRAQPFLEEFERERALGRRQERPRADRQRILEIVLGLAEQEAQRLRSPQSRLRGVDDAEQVGLLDLVVADVDDEQIGRKIGELVDQREPVVAVVAVLPSSPPRSCARGSASQPRPR
jgi:hypothetical protein